jgi:purine-binding chemotaxis protein CheW
MMTHQISGEFLTFSVGAEQYCIDILKVREIRGCAGVTKLPNSSAEVAGVINLRGVIVPLIDLRVRFGDVAPAFDGGTIVIVLALAGQTVGVVVDGVSDVIALAADAIKAPPAMSSVANASILGMASVGERMVMALDIEGLLSSTGLDPQIMAGTTKSPHEAALAAQG